MNRKWLGQMVLGAGLTLMSSGVWAQFASTKNSVCGFFSNINALLGMASVAIVTIAIIFVGYQIAFAHKRIADVAPVLIGGLLIGAAAQIAAMLLPQSPQCTSMMLDVLRHFV